MTGRYAVAVLFLELPPDQVDVNVHPTKAEVRFRQGSGLYHLVLHAIRERLRAANLVTRLRVPVATIPGTALLPPDATLSAAAMLSRPPDSWEQPVNQGRESMAPSSGVAPAAMLLRPPADDSAPIASGRESMPPPMGAKAIQLYDAYLVMETPEGMLVIDQHALHERILFEQLKRRLGAGPLERQRLLIPEPVDLPAEQSARALEDREALGELGLDVEDFGGGTLLLTSYPAILGNRSPQGILRAAVDHLVSKDRPPQREQLLRNLLSLMACHAAVRAGDRLTPAEIAALVAQRELAEDTHHCPHGRPTSLLLSRQDLDRQFRRT
jgi:DNA mismatch repair protein MutL